MTLLEITMVLGLGLAIVTSAMTQGFQQLQTLRHFRDVEYYSKDVPKVATAINNMCRGATDFQLGQNIASNWQNRLNTSIISGAGGAQGGSLIIRGKERDNAGNERDRSSGLWIYPSDTDPGQKWMDLGDGRAMDGTGVIHMGANRWNLATRTVYGTGIGPGTTKQGWVLIRNIAGISFDYIPGTAGSVLMTVWRQEEPKQTPKVAFEMVLERK
jgi:hypothetical protein